MRWAIFSGPVPYNLLLTLSPQVLAGAGVYGGREVPSNHQFHAIDDPPAATMPRHKKYDWADKKDICYRLWVEEEKSLPQVQEYFSQALGVADRGYLLTTGTVTLSGPAADLLAGRRARFDVVVCEGAGSPAAASPATSGPRANPPVIATTARRGPCDSTLVSFTQAAPAPNPTPLATPATTRPR